jgi:uncharacterized protein YdeI (YjbR/CyaY-like superfamily)
MTPLPDDAIHPLTRAEWATWLRDHHATSAGVWLAAYKDAKGGPRVEYVESVEEALCWGWIDSVKRSLDDEVSLLRFTPRRSGSGWARTNKERIIRLEVEGRMQPAGRTLIEAAKADGSWTLLDDAEAGIVPPDLSTALTGEALRGWDGLPASERKRIIGWLATAKTAPTRARRVAMTVINCVAGRRYEQWTKE